MVPNDVPEPPMPTNATASVVPDAAKTEELKPAIVQALSTVFDPEIPVNIWELGLIYDIAVEVAAKVKAVPGIADAVIDIVWEPPWDKDRMSDAAKLQLGMW